MTAGVASFLTPIGHCGVAWNDVGLVAVQLPEGGEVATMAVLGRRLGGRAERRVPPADVRAAIDAMTALLHGEPIDLRAVAIDLREVPDFAQQVYAVARSIPPGSTLTYGDVATRIGAPGAARAVGRAMGQNPVPIVVPCHRVVASGGGLGGFSARGGSATKRRMLTIEGARPASLFDGLA